MEKEPHLYAVIIGIDTFANPDIPRLKCAVNDAESILQTLRVTHPKNTLHIKALLAPPTQDPCLSPTKENIIQSLTWAAAKATINDTILIYFAGHGGLINDIPCLMPYDAQTNENTPLSLLRIDEMQAPFAKHLIQNKVMFIDCCQAKLDQPNAHPTNASSLFRNANFQWNATAPASQTLMDGFRNASQGWVILMSCGPNERSLEDPHWGEHGIFTHFVAAGLRGKADLDHDGYVGMAELVQYVAQRVPMQAQAIIEEAHNHDLANRPDFTTAPHNRPITQTPVIIWNGPTAIRLTKVPREDREKIQRGIFALWMHHLIYNLPYPLTVQNMLRYGIGIWLLIYTALSTAITLSATPPIPIIPLAITTGLFIFIAWHIAYALVPAANTMRWHTGGYIAPVILILGQLILFTAIAILIISPNQRPLKEAFDYGLALFIAAAITVLFTFNPLHNIVTFAELAQKNERVTLRRIFRQLDQKWINADCPNNIALVTANPRLYQYLALICSIGPIAHAAYIYYNFNIIPNAGLRIMRDLTLLLLIHWPVPWFGACYRNIRAQLLPDQ